MTSGYDQRTPQTHLHPGLLCDEHDQLATFGASAAEWFTPQVPAEGRPVAEVGERVRAVAEGRLRASAGELPSPEV